MNIRLSTHKRIIPQAAGGTNIPWIMMVSNRLIKHDSSNVVVVKIGVVPSKNCPPLTEY